MRCSRSLSTRRSCACRCTSSATSFGWLESAIAGAAAAFFGAPNGSASRGVMGRKRLARAVEGEQTSAPLDRDGEHVQFRGGCGARGLGVTVLPWTSPRLSGRGLNVHGGEAMNAVFAGAQLSVARFEDTKLYRAKFDGSLIVRTIFTDARLGAASMEKADFSGARLIDVSMRGANLMGASFARATLIGVDLRDAALTGADFSGATTIACHLPAGSGA